MTGIRRGPVTNANELERRGAEAHDAIRREFFGPWKPTPIKSAVYAARAWEVVLCDPTGGAFPVLLPSPQPGFAWIAVVNVSASSNNVTLRAVSSGVTVNGGTTYTMSGSRRAIVLIPASLTSWVVLGAPTGALGAIQYLDTRNSPVGLWTFNGDKTDQSGNGLDLELETGTEIYADIVPGKKGLYLNGSTRLWRSTYDASLAIAGAVTMICVLQLDSTSSSFDIVSFGGTTETEADNLLYLGRVSSSTPPCDMQWLHERGAGVNETFSTPSSASLPPIHNVLFVGWTRDGSDNVTCNANGRTLGTSASPLTTATGGTSGRFRVGGTAGTTATRCVIMSCKIVARAYTEEDFQDEYNYALGQVYGEAA